MSFLKNTSVYFSSNIINAIIPFLLLPILTRYLSVAEYGQVAMFQTLLSGLITLVGFNSMSAANRKFYDENISIKTLKQFNGACLQILLFSFLLILLLTLYFENSLIDFLSIPSSWIITAIFISVFIYIINLRLGQWQIRSKAKYFGMLQVSSSLLNIVLSIIFILIIIKGAEGRIEALLITNMIIALVSVLLLYKDNLISFFCFKPQYIKEALRFGVPLIPHTFGFFLITSVDRFFIKEKLGLSEAGIYMVAVQLSLAMVVIFDAINKAYVPWLFERLKRNNIEEKKDIVKKTYIYCALVFILSFLGFIIGPYVVTLISGEDYKSAGDVIGWLCLGQAFGGMYLMFSNYMFFEKKTGRLALVTVTTGVINIGLLIYLIDIIGLEGAAIAFFISKLFQFLMTFYLATKVSKLPWKLYHN